MGMSVDEIATDYDLTLGQIYAALSYYHDHREAIDAAIRADEAFVEEVRNPGLKLLGLCGKRRPIGFPQRKS
jgi:uncharacterized protein DUF433